MLTPNISLFQLRQFMKNFSSTIANMSAKNIHITTKKLNTKTKTLKY